LAGGKGFCNSLAGSSGRATTLAVGLQLKRQHITSRQGQRALQELLHSSITGGDEILKATDES
jgi:hypothetical protein